MPHPRKDNKLPVARTKRGKLTVEDIFANNRLQTIWVDMSSGVTVAETALKLNIHENAVIYERRRIREAVESDPEIRNKFRKKLFCLFPSFIGAVQTGLQHPLHPGAAGIINSLGRGLGIYRNEDSMDVTVQNPEELTKRRLAQVAAGAKKLKR